MTYRIMLDDRKQAVTKIEEMIGERPVFTRFPRNAFLIRGLALESDNRVTVEANADMALLQQLISAGLVEAQQEAAEAAVFAGAEETGEAGDQEEEAQDAATAEEGALPGELTENMAEPEELEPETDEEDEPYGDLVTNPQPVRPVVSFDITQHRVDSICNLVFTVFSRGGLISKATGGTFTASEELVEVLQTRSFYRLEEVLEAIREAGEGALQGLSFEDGRVNFDGFPATKSQETIQAWTALATAINKTAIRQKHVRAKKVDDANERFAFRTWLTRLGMNGPHFKMERSILYRNLSGHTAFRTPEDAEKWTRRQNAKRQALRALKEGTADESAQDAAEQTPAQESVVDVDAEETAEEPMEDAVDVAGQEDEAAEAE